MNKLGGYGEAPLDNLTGLETNFDLDYKMILENSSEGIGIHVVK